MMLREILLSLVSASIGGCIAGWILSQETNGIELHGHVRVKSLEVVDESGVLVRLGSHRGAGQIQLSDGRHNEKNRGQFWGVGKDYLHGYTMGFSAHDKTTGILLGVTRAGASYIQLGDGEDLVEALRLGASGGSWWLQGLDEDGGAMLKVDGDKERAEVQVGHLEDGSIIWRKL